MKLHALILSSLLAVAGCEKTSNVTAMQDEVTALTNHYKTRFDELSRRITQLEQRGRSMVSVGMPQGLNDVRRLFLDTNKRLSELKTAVAQVPGSVNNATKGENPRVELIRLMGELEERFEKGETEVNANIDQVEQWLAYVEYRPKVAAAEPTEPPKPPEPQPENPDMKPEPGAGSAAAPDAPKPDAPKPDAPKPDAPKPATPGAAQPAPAGSGSAR